MHSESGELSSIVAVIKPTVAHDHMEFDGSTAVEETFNANMPASMVTLGQRVYF